MNIAIDALPINHLSGRHVLSGHLRMLAKYQGDCHQFYVLHHHNNRDLCCDLGPNFHWLECPNFGENWVSRLWWQLTRINSLLSQFKIELVISTSGALVPGVSIPQIVLAQNPWCYVPQFHETFNDHLKAWLQRQGYRKAQRDAQAMFYLSNYVAQLYQDNAGYKPQLGKTLYVGIDETTFAVAAEKYSSFEERPLEILAVSAMTPHKVIEEVVKVLHLIHQQNVKAHLNLVGPWSNDNYRRKVETFIHDLNLMDYVTITGKVSEAELQEYYRCARIFCLLSRCESFGIPAVEAQAFGTPSIVANVCAPPEVAGPGGVIVPPGAIKQTADIMCQLLTNPQAWQDYSTKALENAERFRWDKVCQPLNNFLKQLST